MSRPTSLAIVVSGFLAGLLGAAAPSPASGQSVWVEAETAFEVGSVRGTARPRHHMVASGGYCIGDGWGRRRGDEVECSVELEEDARGAQLTLRYAIEGPAGDDPVVVSVATAHGTAPFRDVGQLTLPATGRFEIFALGRLRLGDLAAGTHRLRLTTETDREVWIDGFAISEATDVPSWLERRTTFDNRPGGHFQLVFSPHVRDESLEAHEQVFEKLEAQYAFLAEYLGTEPATSLVCCVSAPEDAADGPAHARGNVFFFQEPELTQETSGNMLHEMTHCFQDDDASCGTMPRWLREAEAFFTWSLGEMDTYGREVDELWAGAFPSEDRLRSLAFDEQGLNVVQFFATSQQRPGDRPYYAIWNWVFRELVRHDRELFRRYHDRVRADIAKGLYPLSPEDTDDPALVSGTAVRYLIGDDPVVAGILEDWGFITWPARESLPFLGEEVVTVECGVRAPADRNLEWHPKHDERRVRKGFGVEVSGAMVWRSGDEHQWFYGDPRFGNTPMVIALEVPTDFVGNLVLHPDPRGRRQELRLESVRPMAIDAERSVVLPITPDMARDGKIHLTLNKLAGTNGALLGLALHREPRGGRVPLSVRCGRGVKDLGSALPWHPVLDEAEVAPGFEYEVLEGFAWSDGRDAQWFGNDRRGTQRALRFAVNLPKRFRGHLVVRMDVGGRVQRVVVEDAVMFVARGDQDLWIPLQKEWTQDGRVEVSLRRIEGINAAIREIRLVSR